MYDANNLYPQIGLDLQVHLWTHPSRLGGCVCACSSGTMKAISLDLATTMRHMTGDVSIADIAREIATPDLPIEAAREMVSGIARHLLSEGLATVANAARPPRSFARAVPHEALLHVMQLQLTNQCNLTCDHCYAESSSHGERGLALADIEALIDQFVDLGGVRVFLTGGEALMRPDLEDIVAYAKKRCLFVYLNSNGFAMTPARAARLVRLGVGAINFSLDGGNAETHDRFRRRKGAFDRTLAAIDAVISNNVPVGVQTTVHKGNLGQCTEILRLTMPRGVDTCFFVPMLPVGRATRFPDQMPTSDEFRAEMMEVELARYRPPPDGAMPNDDERYGPGSRCTAANGQIYIRADGTCFPCTSLDGDVFVLGRFPDSTLEEIWTCADGPAPTLRAFDPASIEQCRGCDRQPQCRGACAANAQMLRGDWKLADPNGCLMSGVRREVARLAS